MLKLMAIMLLLLWIMEFLSPLFMAMLVLTLLFFGLLLLLVDIFLERSRG